MFSEHKLGSLNLISRLWNVKEMSAMDDCCQVPARKINSLSCPVCHQKGNTIQIITLKALLTPAALQTINPASSYAFCSNADCEVVYFTDGHIYNKDSVKVPVFQKDEGRDVPVCYCFGWTRERLIQASLENQNPVRHISEQVQANRCGCEVNNPQGSCCLGNVTAYIHHI